jgi:RND family efflux transporter MFP subunit
MNTKKLLWIFTLVALIVMMVLQLKKNKEITLTRVYHYDKSAPISIYVDTIEPVAVHNITDFSGTFKPVQETKISAEVPGKIQKFYVNEGSVVKKGDPIAQQDKSDFELQLKQIEVTIKGLEDDVKRYSVLKKADAVQGVKLEKAQLGLQNAKIQKAMLEDKIKKTTIRAPFDGIVTMKFKEKGEYAAPGMPMVQLVNISQLKFNINVSEKEIKWFETGKEIPVVADVFPLDTLHGEITSVSSEANKMSNLFPVLITVDNTEDLKIKSGMFGRAYIDQSGDGEQIIIEASSIVGSSIKPQVYLVKNGKAFLHDIVISGRFKNKAVVSQGLQAGDIIVTTGFINLFDGANVIIKN